MDIISETCCPTWTWEVFDGVGTGGTLAATPPVTSAPGAEKKRPEQRTQAERLNSTLKKWDTWWKHDGNMMGKWWKHDGNMMETWWENDGKMMETWWEHDGNMMGKWWEHDGNMMGQWWEHDGNMMGTWWKHDRNIMENMMGTWWFDKGKHITNG